MHHYKLVVYLALFGWIPLVLCLFAVFPPRKAMLIGFIGGWMFLPVAVLKFTAIPAYSKLTAASYACVLGTVIFAPRLLLTFRPRWFDLPMLVMCISPFFTSLNNGLGAYDGGSAVIEKIALWGLPYFLGRIYFPDWESLTDLGKGILIGTLIYCPLCWFEMRFSPQLHRMLYGFFQNDFVQTLRMGGYRPMVFLEHGLAVAMWMNGGALIGIWMWMSGSFKRLIGVPIYVIVPTIVLTTLVCRSLAGLLLLFAGIAAILSIRLFRNPIPLLALFLVAPTYMYVRTSGMVSGDWAINKVLDTFGPERAQSFEVRIRAENLLSARALEQPWFGWGRFNRNRVVDIHGKDSVVTDGLWILTFGTCGAIGLIALTASVLLPTFIVWARCPLKYWSHPGVAATSALAVLLVLHMIDNILNGMLDPVFILAMGGLAGVAPSIRRQVRQLASRPAQPIWQPGSAPGALPQPAAARAASGFAFPR
ncbi:MAG TPA: hypothetical protein VH370_24255 [Humisphaera sp.]|jgi:hypothetical protein|nr:hypothetical protein [Humisphaera sp.]